LFSSCLFTGSRMKTFFVLLFLFIFSFPNSAFDSENTESIYPSDLTMKEQYEAGHWITKPSNNVLTVIGVSNPMIRRQDEIAAAKEDAARKVAMYFYIQGRIETANNTSSNLSDYLNDSNIEIIYDTDFEKYKSQLSYNPQDDVLVTREAVFVRFQYAATVTGINYESRIVKGRPNWIRNSEKPEFEGYLTAVGFSKNQRRLKDTIYKSTEDAAARMIEGLSTTVNTKEISITGKSSSSYIHTVSEGKLYGFQAIEFWIDPETSYVYTLAIARTGD